MTSPPRTTDAPPAAAAADPSYPAPRRPRPTPKKFYALLAAALFAALVVTHLPHLSLPYGDDEEAGHLIPAARDFHTTTGEAARASATQEARAPLVAAYLALAWRLFGFHVRVTRAAMLLVAALALAGLFRLAERTAGRGVAWATLSCAALYPVFFAESPLAHADVAAATLTLWGLVLYLPPGRAPQTDEGVADYDGAARLRRRAACVALFALAATAKGTALLAPLALAVWEVVGHVVRRLKPGAARAVFLEPGRPAWHTALLTLALVPPVAWLLYQQRRTGYFFFGDAEGFRVAESTVSLARFADAVGLRLRQVLTHMNLWALTAPAAAAMLRRARRDGDVERRRIDARVQLVFAVVVVAYVAALSMVGGAAPAREMLPAVPLVILVCVSTIRRRVRLWPLVIVAVCAAFVFGAVSN